MMILKIICLFIGVLFTFVNITKAIHKTSIFAINFILQTAGVVGFIVLQWLI